MTVKASTALRNHALGIASAALTFKNGVMVLYTGQSPVNAEDAATGTALVRITDAAQVQTPEVLATGSLTITGNSGSITGITVNGVPILDGQTIAYTQNAPTTANLVQAAIDRAQSYPQYLAKSASSTVTIQAQRSSGSITNGYVVAVTGTLACTTSNMAGGVDATKGLKFEASAGGILVKSIVQEWAGIIAQDGQAGYWRLYTAVADAGGLDASETYPRLQGTLATTGGDINLTSLVLKGGTRQTINAFQVSLN